MSTTDRSSQAGEFVPGPGDDATDLERELWAAIDEIPDPHMPVSIAELGMVYGVTVDGDHATVEMTFPCMGCPAYGMINEDVEAALLAFDAIESVTIDIVWDPVWTKDMLADDVKAELNDWGIAL